LCRPANLGFSPNLNLILKRHAVLPVAYYWKASEGTRNWYGQHWRQNLD
jgi:hypothetical protein